MGNERLLGSEAGRVGVAMDGGMWRCVTCGMRIDVFQSRRIYVEALWVVACRDTRLRYST